MKSIIQEALYSKMNLLRKQLYVTTFLAEMGEKTSMLVMFSQKVMTVLKMI